MLGVEAPQIVPRHRNGKMALPIGFSTRPDPSGMGSGFQSKTGLGLGLGLQKINPLDPTQI